MLPAVMRLIFVRLMAGVLALTTMGGARSDDTFVGAISDSMCATSHESMKMGPTDGECTDACIEEHGATYVLVNGEHVYRLSDQVAPRKFAGQKVKVAGTLDAATSTITVSSITGA
jgi:Protein of unknown function (DUF5818)